MRNQFARLAALGILIAVVMGTVGCKTSAPEDETLPETVQQTTSEMVEETVTEEVTTESESATDELTETSEEETTEAETTQEETTKKESVTEATTSNAQANNNTTQTTAQATTQPPTQATGYIGRAGKAYYEFGLYSVHFQEEDLKEADRIIDSLNYVDGSRYAKAKAVMDWLIINCHQFDESLNSHETNSAHSIFQNHSGLCNGYAQAYYVMMTELGVPCQFITGMVGTQGYNVGHAWVTVMMDDNKWYIIDVNNTDMNLDGNNGDDPTGANANFNLFLQPYQSNDNNYYRPAEGQSFPTPGGDTYDYQQRAKNEQTAKFINQAAAAYESQGKKVVKLGGRDTIYQDIVNLLPTLADGDRIVLVSEVSQKGMQINWCHAAEAYYSEVVSQLAPWEGAYYGNAICISQAGTANQQSVFCQEIVFYSKLSSDERYAKKLEFGNDENGNNADAWYYSAWVDGANNLSTYLSSDCFYTQDY